MAEQRFACTRCGLCCYGWVPLTIDEALAGADRFPLAMAFTPVLPNDRGFALMTELGIVLQLPNHKKAAVLIHPISYLPPSMPCPALSSENLCSIQETKPLRCRAMPFFAYREEGAQADLLVPRKGWVCDTSGTAPVVYRDKHILDRADFDNERNALLAQAPALRTYAEKMFVQNPAVLGQLIKAASSRLPNRMVVSFSSFLRHDRRYDRQEFALRQHKVIAEWMSKTANTPALADYYKYYKETFEELTWFVNRASSSVGTARDA